MEGEKIKEKADKITKYSTKILPKLLIYTKKIKSASDYEDWLKQLNIHLFDWFLETFIIRAFLIFICLLVAVAISTFRPPLLLQFIVAEGISLLWFLLIILKKDLSDISNKEIFKKIEKNTR